MRRTLGVVVVLLSLLSLSPDGLLAQNTSKGRGFQLKGNYPNPFNPTTTIPFSLGAELFESGRPVVVSIRIYNVLQQPVAFPTAENHPQGGPVDNLVYTTPGDYTAYWDGTDRTGNKVASGIYYYILVVNGVKSTARKMVVLK